MTMGGAPMEWTYRPGEVVWPLGRSERWAVVQPDAPHWSWLGGTPRDEVRARARRRPRSA